MYLEYIYMYVYLKTLNKVDNIVIPLVISIVEITCFDFERYINGCEIEEMFYLLIWFWFNGSLHYKFLLNCLY